MSTSLAATTASPPKPPGPPKPPPPVVAESVVSGSLNPSATTALSPGTNSGATPNPNNPTITGYPTSLSPTESNNGRYSVAATAGIGTGVALAVIILAAGLFFFLLRRRRRRQQRRKSAGTMSFDGTAAADAEIARRLSRNPGMHTTPTVPRELPGDQTFPIELPAPLILARSASSKTAQERFGFDEELHVVGRDEKKSGVRLFNDDPIDEHEDDPPPNFAELYPEKAGVP